MKSVKIEKNALHSEVGDGGRSDRTLVSDANVRMVNSGGNQPGPIRNTGRKINSKNFGAAVSLRYSMHIVLIIFCNTYGATVLKIREMHMVTKLNYMKILTKGATVHIVCDKHSGKNIIKSFVYFIMVNYFSTHNILLQKSDLLILIYLCILKSYLLKFYIILNNLK